MDNILNLVTNVDAEYFGLNHLIVDDSSLVNQHPEKTLELLRVVLPENAAVRPPAAEEVLERLGKASFPFEGLSARSTKASLERAMIEELMS